MRKLLLYVRASREDLKMSPEGTLTSQRQRLEEYVKSRNVLTPGWGKIVAIYMDEARSAKDTNRPQFQEMLRMIELRKGDTILVTELSRLSRSMKDFCGIWDFLRAHQAQFLSLREQFDTTTAAGEMMIYSIINFAQFERKQTSERVVANFRARALRGLYNGGYPMLGYDSHPEKKGHLVVNEEEAARVRRIFQIFSETGSVKAALDQINANNILTKRRRYEDGRVDEGRKFNLTSLWGTLRNRHYLGEREINKRFRYSDKENVPQGKEYQTVKASWPAIISPELFQAVQNRLDWNAKRYRPENRRNFDYLYSSTVFCGECGEAMVGRSGKTKLKEKHFYYAHKSKKNKTSKAPGCNCHWYSFDALDLRKIMRNRIRKLADEPTFVEALYRNAKTETSALVPDNERRVSLLQSEIKALNQQIASLMDTLQSNPSQIVRDLVTKELDSKGAVLKAKMSEESSLQRQSTNVLAMTVEQREFSNLAKDWDKLFANLTNAERKDLARTVIGRIEFFPDKLRIRYNYDQHTVAQALNVVDLASARNARGAGSKDSAPQPSFSKKDQRASYSNVILIGRGSRI